VKSRWSTPVHGTASDFGAIEIVAERGDEGVERVKELTGGVGADAVLECVGTQDSVLQALAPRAPVRWSAGSVFPT
jgi:threonine dehydrogenase-like Zn-dependent dehydrogenase